MSDVYVVMEFDDDGAANIKGIYTDPAVAQGIADQERAKPGPFAGGAVVETWELDNRDGHRTKTVYVAINDAPHRHNQEWTVRDPRIEDAELSEPDESVTWRKIGPAIIGVIGRSEPEWRTDGIVRTRPRHWGLDQVGS